MFDYILIGSGPSSIISANELVKSDKKVCILDYGKKNNSSIKNKINQIVIEDPDLINPSSINKIKYYSKSKNYEEKKNFGNNFMYEKNISSKEIDLKSSLAKGGHSNVWGASCRIYDDKQFKEWGLKYTDFSKSYDFILNKYKNFFSDTSIKENFEKNYNDQDIINDKKIKPIFKNILINCIKNKKEILEKKIKFSISSLMIDNKCNNCGLCMYGCPYDYIYNSSNEVKELEKIGLKYIDNIEVISFEINNEVIKVKCLDVISKKNIFFLTKKLLIAAGPINSAKIIFNSVHKINSCEFLETPFYYFPIFNFKNKQTNQGKALSDFYFNFSSNNHYSEAFIELFAFNDYFIKILEEKFFFFKLMPNFILQNIFKKIIIACCFLHSDFSHKLIMKKDNNNYNYKINKNSQQQLKINEIVKRLTMIEKLINVKIFSKPIFQNPFGKSFHIGSSFPMNNDINPNSTDYLGSLKNFSNVHIIDSSIIPKIQPNTFTLGTMVNAHRITMELLKK